MSSIFDQMISRYPIETRDDELNALHEVMQQITLAALYRNGFFNEAAFYGGTCLRIFHKLERFSEDMDFSLVKTNKNFTLEPYFEAITREFISLGRNVEIARKEKKSASKVESAFLKDNTEMYNIAFQTERSIKIKIEVDKDPPLNFQTESKLLMLPFSFMTRCFTIPCLYAGKMHALLFRNWRNRVKGRDWYDFEWYVRNNHPLNFVHFKERARQSGNINNNQFSKEQFISLLKEKIKSTKIEMVKADVQPFIKNQKALEIWSTEYFLQLAEMIIFE